MKSISYFRGQGSGFSITSAHSGNGTSSAVVKNNMIIVDITALGSEEYVTVNTPFSFEVVDAYLVVGNGEHQANKELTIKNGSTALSSVLSMATDKGVARATTLDEDQAKFELDDNDLKLVSSAHGDGGATVYISFV